jgi:hypothetical protein
MTSALIFVLRVSCGSSVRTRETVQELCLTGTLVLGERAALNEGMDLRQKCSIESPRTCLGGSLSNPVQDVFTNAKI